MMRENDRHDAIQDSTHDARQEVCNFSSRHVARHEVCNVSSSHVAIQGVQGFFKTCWHTRCARCLEDMMAYKVWKVC